MKFHISSPVFLNENDEFCTTNSEIPKNNKFLIRKNSSVFELRRLPKHPQFKGSSKYHTPTEMAMRKNSDENRDAGKVNFPIRSIAPKMTSAVAKANGTSQLATPSILRKFCKIVAAGAGEIILAIPLIRKRPPIIILPITVR